MLDERKKMILTAVIEDYVLNAEPVGSKKLVEKFNLKVSPATVRNELAVLEEMGYLKQPHTSAGRVPSDLGYRFYVDSIFDNKPLPVDDSFSIIDLFSSINHEIEELIRETSSILSKLTSYVSLVFAPSLSIDRLKHLDIVPLHGNKVLLVIITNSGAVAKRAIDFGKDYESETIEGYQRILNERLIGMTSSEIKEMVFDDMAGEKNRDQLGAIVKIMVELMADHDFERVYHDGTVNLLSQPEFESLNRVQRLVSTLEKSYELLDLLSGVAKEYDMVIKIGSENRSPDMDGCSVIATSYRVEGKSLGALGIIGPTRMDYRRTIAAVQYVADKLSDLLKSIHERG